MCRWRLTGITLCVACLLVSGCNTRPGTIQTPSGDAGGRLFGQMSVLGVLDRRTITRNRDNAHEVFEDIVTVQVPVGTQAIVASLRGWGAGFGKGEFDEFGPGISSFVIHTDQRPFGFAQVHVEVVDLNAPNLSVSPPTQTAQVRVRMMLTDKNQDDRWFGFASYSLLCLGELPG